MKLSGTMVGFSAEYLNSGGVGRIKQSMPIQLRARFNFMFGNLKYDGKLYNFDGHGNLVSITPYSYKGDDNYFTDFVFAGGFEAKIKETFSISPYMGLGYRYLEDKGNGSPYSYKREQVYYYLPIGADWTFITAPGWRLAFNTELNVLLRGENTSHGVSGSGNLNFRQNSGYGLKFATKIEKDFRRVGVFAEPFYRYWDIKKSDVQYVNDRGIRMGFVEPKNNTHEFGARIGVSF